MRGMNLFGCGGSSRLALAAVAAAGLAVGVPGSASAQEGGEAGAESGPAITDEAGLVLIRAREAMLGLERLHASLTMGSEGGGGLARLMPSGTTSVKIVRGELEGPADGGAAGSAAWTMLAEGTLKERADAEEERVTLFVAPDRVAWVDRAESQVRVRPAAGAKPELANEGLMFPLELLEPAPLSSLLAEGRNRALLERAEVDGVLCDVVQVESPRRRRGARNQPETGPGGLPVLPSTTTTWYVGVEDGLVRRVDRTTGSGALSLTLTQRVTELAPGGSFEVAELDPENNVPDGFRVDKLTAGPGASGGGEAAGGDLDPDRVREEVRRAREKAEAEAAARADAADRAPEFEVRTEDGTLVTRETLAGAPAVLYFWGTWCVPCRTYGPLVSEMTERLAADGLPVRVLGVACNERRGVEKAFEYAEEKGYAHEVVVSASDDPREDTAFAAARAFKVTRYPSIIVLDAEGRVVSFEASTRADEAGALVERIEEAARQAAG